MRFLLAIAIFASAARADAAPCSGPADPKLTPAKVSPMLQGDDDYPLAEMRRLLGAMRDEREEVSFMPQPGLDGLDSLLDEVTRAGLPVELHVDGEPFPLPRGVDLSAYRIVQEALTNALKHAHATAANVTVRYAFDELAIEVRDNGVGNSTTTDGLGHGLVGVRERVKIYGGEMSAGTANGGGFVLSTRLPLSGDRP